MADTDVWGLGGPIAAPAATDRAPWATGPGAGGYSTRGDFVWKNGLNSFVLAAGAGAGDIVYSNSAGNFTAGIPAGVNQWRIIENQFGRVALVVDGSANVGIGRTPVYKLDVGGAGVGSGANQVLLRLMSNSDASSNSIDLNFQPIISGGTQTAIRAQRSGSTPHSDLAFITNNSVRVVIDASGNVIPGADNAQTFGWPSARWSVIYAATGTINTCDIRLKFYRAEPAPTADEHAAALECFDAFGFFQHLDAIAREADGGSPARWHFSPKAQDVWSIFASHGLAPALIENAHGDLVPPPGSVPPAFLCFDEWDEETAPVMAWWRPSDILGPDGQPVMIPCAEGEEGTEQRPTGETYVVREAGNIFGIRIDQLQSLMLVALNKERLGLEARIAALEPA